MRQNPAISTGNQPLNGLTEPPDPVAVEVSLLATAYPTQTRNFTPQEVVDTNSLWLETFGGIDPRLLHAAVMRFISTDRKGFFPSPGQIIGIIEQGIIQNGWRGIGGEQKKLLQQRFNICGKPKKYRNAFANFDEHDYDFDEMERKEQERIAKLCRGEIE